MAHIPINFGGGSGSGSDDCTAAAGDVIKGKTAIVNGSDDDPVNGTLELTGNAQAPHVLAGETFYTTNPKSKLTGTMMVNSILSFSAQAYSGRQVLLKWQNPYAATGRPFTGVNIAYSTAGYPPDGGGTWLWSGCGNNTAPGGWSQILLTLPDLNTTYYFNANSYVNTSSGVLWGPILHAETTTSNVLWLTFTESQNYVVPAGYNYMHAFAVGGGGKGNRGSGPESPAGGAGGGYTNSAYSIEIAGGQIMNVVVGSGGTIVTIGDEASGGDSYVLSNGMELVRGFGGRSRISTAGRIGGNGGSGGGAGGYIKFGHQYTEPCAGGFDGGDGGRYTGTYGSGEGGIGQHRTTRSYGWIEQATIYAGGGGGGGHGRTSAGGYASQGAPGGTGGGGAGGAGGELRHPGLPGVSGMANSGGGGGGGGAGGSDYSDSYGGGVGGDGGSGIVLLCLH